MSTETLLRGVELTRAVTMSLESDPDYLAMMAEKDKLQASSLQPIPDVFPLELSRYSLYIFYGIDT